LRIFSDTASGALAERIELAQVLDHLREGDTLVVWRLDRLGRSLRGLGNIGTKSHAKELTGARMAGVQAARAFGSTVSRGAG
jgi:DNA invertase Pin-like site-specific DNA recombinase